MRISRFRVAEVVEGAIELTGREADHAQRVLRLGVGDPLALFDGAGREVDGVVAATGPHRLLIQTTGPIHEVVPVQWPLIVAAAVPKGERADWLVEKCAEFGVHTVRWIETERSAVVPGAGKLTRWRRKATEAAKQAGLAREMAVEGPMSIIDAAGADGPNRQLFFGDPSIEAPTLISRLGEMTFKGDRHGEIIVLVGPEGGWTQSEIDSIKGLGGQPARLADSILRIETAAVAVAAIWSCSEARKPV